MRAYRRKVAEVVAPGIEGVELIVDRIGDCSHGPIQAAVAILGGEWAGKARQSTRQAADACVLLNKVLIVEAEVGGIGWEMNPDADQQQCDYDSRFQQHSHDNWFERAVCVPVVEHASGHAQHLRFRLGG